MKKFLSLVLALIMVMSLVTVGAGAVDFTDAEDIQYTEAVELMTSLGILKGYGSDFQPQGNLTRGAAAKIVAYIALGKEAAEELSGDDMPFTDVAADSSMRPYIAWAAEQGIINGTTADGTKFEPKEYVSGHAFLKMVLGVLHIEGVYTGTNWRTNVTVNAANANLFTGIDTEGDDAVSFKENITREVACQVAFNAMNWNINGGVTETKYTIGGMSFDEATDAAMYRAMMGLTEEIKTTTITGGKLLETKYGNVKYVDVVIEKNAANDAAQVAKKTTVDTAGNTYAVDTGLELVGHKVRVYYKDADKGNDYDYTSTKAETVVSVVDLSKVITVASKVEKTSAKAVKELLGLKTVTGTINASFDIENYVKQGSADANPISYNAANGTDKEYTVAAGTYVVAGEALVSYMTTSSSVADFTISVNSKGYYTVKDGETVVYKTAEKAADCVDLDLTNIDWADMGATTSTPAGAVYVVTKIGQYYSLAEVKTITGKITKIEDVADATKDAIYVDGVKKSVNTSLTTEAGVLDAAAFAFSSALNFQDTYTFYLDQAGKIFAYVNDTNPTPVVSDATIIIPTLVYSKTSEVKQVKDEYGNDTVAANKVGKYYSVWTQGVTLTGEVVELQVLATTKFDGNGEFANAVEAAVSSKAVTPKSVYTYTTLYNTTTEEDIATLDPVAAADENADKKSTEAVTEGAVPASTAKKVTIGANNYWLNDTFKVIYINNSGSKIEVVVKDGTVAQIVKDAVVYGTKTNTTDRNFELQFVVINGEPSGDTAGTDLIYATGVFTETSAVPYTKADGKTGTAYEQIVYINGEKTTILTASDLDDVVTGAGFYNYTVDAQGLYTLTDDATKVIENTYIDTIYKGMITISSTLVDVDVTDVKVVDLRTGVADDKKITDATKLTSDYKLALVYSGTTTKTVKLIYVIDKTAADVQAAITNATGAVTIKLTNDIDLGNVALIITNDDDVTLDLNGFDVTSACGNYTIDISDAPHGFSATERKPTNGKLTIKGEGTITNTSAGSSVIRNYGTLIIGENGKAGPTVTRGATTNGAGNSAVKCEETSTLTINSGIIGGDTRSIQCWGTATINGGTFLKKVEAWEWTDGSTNYPSVLTIKGGTFEGAFATGKVGANEPEIVIEGGTFANDPTPYVNTNTHAVTGSATAGYKVAAK